MSNYKKMTLRLAFIGFRHGHILDLYRRAHAREDVDVVAACEEDAATRETWADQAEVHITHTDARAVLEDVQCDAVAIGDYYARRGALAIAALRQNKHVISDKPLCTDLDELDTIIAIAANKGLKVGCMLTLRDAAPFMGVRHLVEDEAIGDIHAVSFDGQHPLLLGTRPDWYFEPGKHGGTINDIAMHAVDVVSWITGQHIVRINAARCWNALATPYPHFKDAAQMMLTLENGGGVLGDVSYLAPGSVGYTLPTYWRMTFWGQHGIIETSLNASHITMIRESEEKPQRITLSQGNPGGYLEAFLHDIAGASAPYELTTAQVLNAARTTLMIQRTADNHLYDVELQ